MNLMSQLGAITPTVAKKKVIRPGKKDKLDYVKIFGSVLKDGEEFTAQDIADRLVTSVSLVNRILKTQMVP